MTAGVSGRDHLTLGGCDAIGLASEFGTPLYVFDEETLRGMLAAKDMGSGLSAEAQVFLGMMDMAFHTDADGEVDTTSAPLSDPEL